jgi:hypothetical protein
MLRQNAVNLGIDALWLSRKWTPMLARYME